MLFKDLTEKQGNELLKLIADMSWDYDRFSISGQETYDKIYEILDWQSLRD
jgi:hypothetical protein